MDIFRVQQDGSEDLVASGLHPAEVDGLLEWFCYTKPIGRDVRIVVRPTSEGDSEFSVLAAGTEPEPPESECAKASVFAAGGAAMCDRVPCNGTAAALQGW
jgi:hypothetical protein